MLERYPVFNIIDDYTIHIKVPRERVAKGLLVYSFMFLAFAFFIIIILLKDRQPPATLFFSLPPFFFSLIAYGLYKKWYETGQIVKIDKDNSLLILEEKIVNYIPSQKKYKIEDIRSFIIAPFVAYRSGSSPGAAKITRGYCVMIQFVRKKLFWFIEKDTPIVNIGAYLEKEEALALKLWLEKVLNFKRK